MKIFSRIGEMTKEAGFAGGNSAGTFGQTREQAQEAFNEIQAKRINGEINDFVWNKEYANPGGKIDQLMKKITG